MSASNSNNPVESRLNSHLSASPGERPYHLTTDPYESREAQRFAVSRAMIRTIPPGLCERLRGGRCAELCRAQVPLVYTQVGALLLDGTEKNLLSDWLLRLIAQRADQFLCAAGFEPHSHPANYIEKPPASIEAVPVSGLVVGAFVRKQTELETALEVWDKPAAAPTLPPLEQGVGDWGCVPSNMVNHDEEHAAPIGSMAATSMKSLRQALQPDEVAFLRTAGPAPEPVEVMQHLGRRHRQQQNN
mmetsp:Transcript_26315/g.66169  ORF Transcript_26315/g.66169 Transcript_26315/m.66169 type:complete len:245 (+) Transcript_26315:93-827(+)